MDLAQIITGCILTGIVTLMWWDVRTIRNETEKKLKIISDETKSVASNLNECEKSLPKDYASRESVDKLWSRTDKHESDLSFLKGKFNGAARSG